ncbi:MAG: EF-hand domain-containing protein [Armatimonadetes bacterium]|nr:EF-hand domain-containing protein [Armatimonadota bacterium]
MTKSRTRTWSLLAGVSLLLSLTVALAGGDGGTTDKPKGDGAKADKNAVAEQTFNKMDTNQDGAVTADEVPAERWEKLQRADGDQNGKVSLDELKAFWGGAPKDKPAPRDMFQKFDTNQDGRIAQDEAPADLWGKISGADKDGDGGVTLDEFRAAHPPADGAPKGDRPDIMPMFNKHDTNQDGKLTADEVPAEFWAKLSASDKDGDGAVSADEAKAGQPAKGGGDVAGMFKNLDADGDGKLTQGELPAGKWEKLSAADADGDGALTLDEFRAGMTRGGGQEGKDVFAKHDKNGDGALTQDEVPAEHWEKVSRADADGDGRVTADELKAAHGGKPK